MLRVGPVEPLQELTGVSGEALQVAALGLGVEGIEDQAALAGTADAGDDGESAERNLDVDPLQVVDTHAVENDGQASLAW